MTDRFDYHTTVRPEWIDYNDHMRDAYYGLVFSYAVDAFQDAVGLDGAYRTRSGCTIYLVEDHKHFLREVKRGAAITVETRLLDHDAKRFHLWSVMREGEAVLAVAEMMELHVARDPGPRVAPMPEEIQARLRAAQLPADAVADLPHRARAISV
jgi:acyl-CoA thioester hydrolase